MFLTFRYYSPWELSDKIMGNDSSGNTENFEEVLSGLREALPCTPCQGASGPGVNRLRCVKDRVRL